LAAVIEAKPRPDDFDPDPVFPALRLDFRVFKGTLRLFRPFFLLSDRGRFGLAPRGIETLLGYLRSVRLMVAGRYRNLILLL
jgi:hypothetical protein